MTRDRKMNGDWGKPRPARGIGARDELDDREREVFERLLGARSPFWGGYGYGYGYELSQFELRGILLSDVLPVLCGTERCLMRVDAAHEPTALRWDDGPPWRLSISVHCNEAGYRLTGQITRGEEMMAPDHPVLVLDGRPFGVLLTGTHAARLDAGGAFPWLAALRREGVLEFPTDAREDLTDALMKVSPVVVELPEELRVETLACDPQPRLRLAPSVVRHDRLRADLAFDYGGARVEPGTPGLVVRPAGSARAFLRNAEAERRAEATLREQGARFEWDYQNHGRVLHLPSHKMPRVVRSLVSNGWHVEASGRIVRQPGTMSVSVQSGVDWFELHGHVEYDTRRAPLPALLAALDKGEQFVTLDDGTLGVLPEEWLRRHATVGRLGTRSSDHLRFTRSQAGLLDALIAGVPEATWDEAFAGMRVKLQSLEGVRPEDPPPAFSGTLRDYQRDGLGWLLYLQQFGFGGCLADDMGLGKTVMVLALLAARRAAAADDRRPSLVVAPRSVVFNWREEARRFTPELRVIEYLGTGRAEMRGRLPEHDVVLTTYGTLRRDAPALTAAAFDYVVLDEAQAIKNASSVSAKATRVLHARHRLALSGTPIENHLGELWSLFEFLNPGLLSSGSAFAKSSAGAKLDDEAVALLAKGLRPFILRRTKEQVAKELPEKTEQTLHCELERPQRVLYDELRQHYRRRLLDGTDARTFARSKLHVLEALLRLRQAACHPGLIDRRRQHEASAKLEVLMPRLAEAVDEGHKTLVFSQFTSLLALVRERLDKEGLSYEYLDGQTRDRQASVNRFQSDSSCRLFLISLKAGGLGLNLTAAEYVFLLDPWWNPAVEAQAIDRAHRIGQARHVFAYRLIARDTVEERILELQQKKRSLTDAILTADNAVIRNLQREDLDLLLS
jgi:superfamily II DNA or RNA helicase